MQSTNVKRKPFNIDSMSVSQNIVARKLNKLQTEIILAIYIFTIYSPKSKIVFKF